MNDLNKIVRLPVKRAEGSEPMTRAGQHFTFPGASYDPTGLDWLCPLCGVQVLPQHLVNGLWVRRRACTCQVRRRREQEEYEQFQAWDAAQSARTFGGWLGIKWHDDIVVKTLKQKTFASFDEVRNPGAYSTALAFATSMSGNLLLYGDYGTGKSHLAAAICNRLRTNPNKEKHVASLFLSAGSFFAAYHDRQQHGDDCYWLERQATQTPLLVIDDPDKVEPTPARLTVYWRILEGRYAGRRPTIITTNRMASLTDETGRVIQPGLADYIGGAARSRFMRGLVAVEMQGGDYRMEER